MNFFQRLLSDDSDVSCMRLMSLISLFIGGSIAYVSLFENRDLSEASPTIGVFVGAAFGGKVWQKYAERKDDK